MTNPRSRAARGSSEQTDRAGMSTLTIPRPTDEVRQPCRLCPLCACGFPECRAVELVEAVIVDG